jgi:Zn-dependent protease with chaperone function
MSSDKTIATAQVGLSAVFLAGYFLMLALFLLGEIHTPPEWRDQLGILLGVLTAGVMLILNFWFSRHRPTGDVK